MLKTFNYKLKKVNLIKDWLNIKLNKLIFTFSQLFKATISYKTFWNIIF